MSEVAEKIICNMYKLANPEDSFQTKGQLESKLSQLRGLLAALSSGFLEVDKNDLADAFSACSSLADECFDLFQIM